MGEQGRVAVIGGGLTGLTCARALADAGHAVAVFDKGRGIGGRLATRRTEGGLRFDHGAQVLPATDPGFAALLDTMVCDGHAAEWNDGFVGTPGMAQIPRALAQGMDVYTGAMVTALDHGPTGWHLRGTGIDHHADTVVLAIPAPQARDLLGAGHAFVAPLAQVRYQASITVMAGLDPEAPRPFVTHRGTGALAWVAQDGAKPGRDGQPLTTWVVQADPDFSMTHIDLPFAELADLIAPQLLDLLGARPDHLHHAVAHRWLYALTETALGQPFLADDTTGLIVGGDWALGPHAEHGWASGRAMAAHLLARP
ncbi:NAD(P)/FAD-dependent oxidoreductase [Paracoccus sp. Ld10]|uniref:NAD(P)/FAD-dependent oxidoreductase n=1 Tax=Paracoccus sp. Ld10 TaxID=649158 RepID=UPI0038686E02